MKDDVAKILDAAKFMIESQGYVWITFVSQATGVPGIVVENVLKQSGYKQSLTKDQYIKE